VALDEAREPAEAWVRLLNRPPRPLEWPDVDPRTTAEHLQGFDFSVRAVALRRRWIPDRRHHESHIRRTPGGIDFRLDGLAHVVAVNGLSDLFQHILLKQILNIHSTVVMGRLGRYESNIMTWVSPTNGKLVDRATRYVEHLLAGAGQTGTRYDEIVRQLFAEMDGSEPGESVVLKTYRALSKRRRPATPEKVATSGGIRRVGSEARPPYSSIRGASKTPEGW
jgi:N-acetylmuramic acid 6-phosphate etherase